LRLKGLFPFFCGFEFLDLSLEEVDALLHLHEDAVDAADIEIGNALRRPVESVAVKL